MRAYAHVCVCVYFAVICAHNIAHTISIQLENDEHTQRSHNNVARSLCSRRVFSGCQSMLSTILWHQPRACACCRHIIIPSILCLPHSNKYTTVHYARTTPKHNPPQHCCQHNDCFCVTTASTTWLLCCCLQFRMCARTASDVMVVQKLVAR